MLGKNLRTPPDGSGSVCGSALATPTSLFQRVAAERLLVDRLSDQNAVVTTGF